MRVVGELDGSTAASISGGLASVTSRDGVVVDVSRLTFMDAAGLHALVAGNERLAAAGGAGLTIRGASGILRRGVELAGLGRLLDDREDIASNCDVLADGDRRALESARRHAGLSVAELFVAYFALGGAADHSQFGAYFDGDTQALDRHRATSRSTPSTSDSATSGAPIGCWRTRRPERTEGLWMRR